MVRNLVKKSAVVAAVAVIAAAGAQTVKAGPINTDLQTLWGVTPGGTSFTGTGSSFANWTPGHTTNHNNSSAVTTGTFAGSSGTYSKIAYSIWDGYGIRNGAIANNGGQAFDVKAMYASYDSTYLHVGIVTGSNPNGFTFEGHSYTAGDLAIDPNLSSNTADLGLKSITAPATTAGDSGTGLSLKSGGTWSNPGANGYTGTPPYTILNGGTTKFSDATYTFVDLGITYADPSNSSTAEEYLMEFNIKKSELGTDINSPLTLGFGPSCGNDYMTVTLSPSTGGGIPEPASLSILGIAGAGLMLRRRKHA
jgi:hypothetical protein